MRSLYLEDMVISGFQVAFPRDIRCILPDQECQAIHNLEKRAGNGPGIERKGLQVSRPSRNTKKQKTSTSMAWNIGEVSCHSGEARANIFDSVMRGGVSRGCDGTKHGIAL